MQTLIDLPIAGFIFLLFASIYKKRSTAEIRFWMVGWFFILIHFAAINCPVSTPRQQALQSAVALGTLALCAISFVLSRAESQNMPSRGFSVCCLLGVPWIGALLLGSLPHPWFPVVVLCAYAGAVSVCIVAVQLFGGKRIQTAFICLVALGCAAWLTLSLGSRNVELVQEIVLTECFGLNAILLSTTRRRVSSATITTAAGAMAWGAVWLTAETVARYAPHASLSPEVWNLPKYFLAAGMVLTLLEEEIRSAEVASEEYRLLFASNPHPMWMYDPETLRICRANDAAVAAYGYSHTEFKALGLQDIVSGEPTAAELAKLSDTDSQQLSGPWLHRRKDGSTLQVEVASQHVLQDGHQVTFALMHDVTERERLHAQLLHQAHHDALTGLPSRALFEQQFHEALGRAEQSYTRLAAFCIDLDRFKQINDSFGHSAGDVCLKEVSSRISKRLNERGIIARRGGDEFLILLGDFYDNKEAEAFATELLGDLKVPVQFGAADLEVGASIGFAIYPEDGADADRLWRDADAAMYQAKRDGGGQWVRVSHEISSSATEANEVELALQRAIKSGNLYLKYQPQMLLDGSFHSMEALFRSDEPSLRDIPVNRVISIAEESGLIVPVGNWVLEEVCRQCREWLDKGLAPMRVAVNVSPLQLTRFDFARHVAKTLARYRLDAHMLEFEVTESTMMPDRGSDALHQIASLARMGISFSVDDFGTGYSSLGRLHQLPVEALKIDQSFTRGIGQINGTYPTVEAIIELAHNFGMKVVAEGVESDEQLRLLRSMGCDRVQGYLFSQPVPAKDITPYLNDADIRTVA